VSFEILEGDTRIILGAAGSGKTVLLKTALGLLRPGTGRVFLFGENITERREADQFDMRSRVGILFQEGGLFESQQYDNEYTIRLERSSGGQWRLVHSDVYWDNCWDRPEFCKDRIRGVVPAKPLEAYP